MQLRVSLPRYALLAFAVAAAVLTFVPVLDQLYQIWGTQPEYSHGVIIPILAAFLIWQQREQLRGLPFTGSWYGLLLVAAGVALRAVGYFSTMHTIERYAFLFVLYGLILSLTGAAVFRRLWMPLAVLIFMVPLPISVTEGLSLKLQMLSSILGVAIIRAAGISVYLAGNIIDLGSYQLEVAAACSGLRYLFPLMTLAFLIAFLFRGPFWKRALILISSVPITVLMNSLRIGLIGISVEHWGQGMAEGALHDFEGWLVFMLSTAALFGVAYGLAKSGKSKTSWADTLGLGLPARPADVPPVAQLTQPSRVPRPFLTAAILVAVLGLASLFAPEQNHVAPPRAELIEFPGELGEWVGQRSAIEDHYLRELQLDDYLLADYQDRDTSDRNAPPINFYVAYYESQNGSRRIHSPMNCMPGGGWQIVKMAKRSLALPGSRNPFPVNRAVIALGDRKAIVYYWFRERGRQMTDENTVKWYLFWDSLTRHRTDGALVRVVAPLGHGATETAIDEKMQRFLSLAEPRLGRFVPD